VEHVSDARARDVIVKACTKKTTEVNRNYLKSRSVQFNCV